MYKLMDKLNANKKIPLIIVLLFILIISYIVYGDINDKSDIKKADSLSPSLQTLKEKVKYARNPREAFGIIVKMYGKANRFLGSGISIAQWDIDGGYVYSHPFFGVSYSKKDYDISDSDAVYFINTENKVEENIIGTYRMTSLKNRVKPAQYWYGYLELEEDGKYFFKDEIWEKEQIKQRNNFFHNNPKGTYTIEYLNNIKADSLLEEMEEGTMLARIKFVSGNKSEILYFSIKGRTIESNEETSFQLYKHWKKSFYRKPIDPSNQSLELLKEEIKYAESYEEALQIIIDMYGDGEQENDIGNPQWQIEGGVLTCDEGGFSYKKNGVTINLIDTKNIVGEIIQGYYEIFALSEQDVNKTTYCLGGIELEPNGRFTFDSDLNKNLPEFKDNFFFNNPEGTYIIDYQNGIKADELLENMADGTKIARVNFFSKLTKESFDIYIKGRTLVLKPADGKLRTYTIRDKHWQNYHVKEDTKK